MLTNLVRNGKVTTTSKRAAVLKAEADALIGRLISNTKNYSEADAKRENIRLIKSVIYSEAEGKKLLNDLLPKFVESGKKKLLNDLLPKFVESGKMSGFVCNYKLGYRLGDGAEKILVKLA